MMFDSRDDMGTTTTGGYASAFEEYLRRAGTTGTAGSTYTVDASGIHWDIDVPQRESKPQKTTFKDFLWVWGLFKCL